MRQSSLISTAPPCASFQRRFRHHLREDVAPRRADPCSSAAWLGLPLPDEEAPVVRPRTWLLRHAGNA